MTAKIIAVLCSLLVILATGSMAAGEGSQSVDPAQVQELQQRMLNDPGIMEIIISMQNDPDMQALLNDPAVTAKIQAGDLDALANDPRMIKLLDKKQVKDVEKRLW
jgi:uncharacterized membrane protein affecting hemolysin expression